MVDPPGALRLRYLTGPQRGATAVLRPPRSRIGRSRDNDVVLADREGAYASGHHAEAIRDAGQWWILDLKTTNGTWVNDARITRAPLRPGDRLRFGDVECEVLNGRFATVAAATAALALVALVIAAYAFSTVRARSFENVASQVARSVYLVAIERGAERQIAGTAFVAADGYLATNAHVADLITPYVSQQNGRAIVVRSDSSDTHPIREVHISRSWSRGSIADDVAALRVSDLAPDAKALKLADTAVIASLNRGMTLATFGFPASSTDPRQPRGRLSVDVLGDVRNARYLAVGLKIAPGTSGSPIFLNDGTVVGLVVGGDFTPTPDGSLHPSGTNVNWGISIAPLRELLRDCGAAPQ